jgi:hypothetical protein
MRVLVVAIGTMVVALQFFAPGVQRFQEGFVHALPVRFSGPPRDEGHTMSSSVDSCRSHIKSTTRLWCILSRNNTDFKGSRAFQHVSRTLFPCWSYFMRTNSTSCCGIVIEFGYSHNVMTSQWLASLLTSYACKVYLNATILPTLRNVFYPPRPRSLENLWIDSPISAAALQTQVLGRNAFRLTPLQGDIPMRVGLIQRISDRRITNYAEIRAHLTTTWANVTVDEVSMEGMPFLAQARFFAEHDIIVAAHGAALTNAVFVRYGTIILECFPQNYYPVKYYQSLVQQSGGIHADWHVGQRPLEDFMQHCKTQKERVEARSKFFSVQPEQAISLLKEALVFRRFQKGL